MRSLVRQRTKRDFRNVMGADEGDTSISTRGEDLVHRADGIHETWLDQVFCERRQSAASHTNLVICTYP